MKLDDTELKALLRLVDATRGREIDCDELLDRIGGYVEKFSGSVRPPGFDDIVQHLQQCPECSEEVEALLEVLGSEKRDDA